MSPLAYIFSAIAVAAGVAAQNQNPACASTNGPYQIQNQGDASNIGGCTTFQGSITIASGTGDKINIPNVRTINGDLVMDGAQNVTSFGADSLQTVTGKFTINNCQMLQQVQFSQLTSVGDLSIQGTPNLNTLGFSKGLTSVKTLNIQNTFLSDLKGINPSSLGSLYIANNRMLQSVSFQVSSVTGSIIVEGNGDKFNVQFPNLQTGQNVTFRNCPSISVPSLMNVTGNLNIIENTISTFAAPNLTAISQTLAINACPQLTNISLSNVKTIGGGFQVQNNSQLLSVTMPSLQTIGGALDFYGNFDNVTLPALKDCRGGFNLQSKSNQLDCSTFNNQHGSNSVIKGTYKCSANVTNPGNITSNPSSGGKKGDAAAYGVPSTGSMFALAGLLVGIMGLL